jgi:protein ImuB
MDWIALLPSHDDERVAWGWWALQFTPRVASLDEALLLEISGSERLFGGRKALLRRLLEPPGLAPAAWAPGPTSLVALALLRHGGAALAGPAPDALPLATLSAARPHLPTLERIGCRTWADLRALPRGGFARRFGAPLLAALDTAYGAKPESHEWLTLPESFDLKVELAVLATSAPELMGAVVPLLTRLQVWLQARHQGVLALELEWTLDLRRLNGKALPPCEQLRVRTAQATQDMAHLRRLIGEQLARTPLAAPANHLRLRSLETLPWGGASRSFLPEDNVKGEGLHQLVERLSARLGEHNVLAPQARSDHRPERMQDWLPARGAVSSAHAFNAPTEPHPASAAIYPPWLLPEPVRLKMNGDTPLYGGPLRRLARLYRVETAWWEEGGPAVRDYFIARSEQAGLVWVFRERPLHATGQRWYLQGLYA